MIREIKKASVWAVVFAMIGLSYVLTAHIGYAHGYEAGYQAIQCEANQN